MKSIYLLPGRGGKLNAGLGLALQKRGFRVVGRETLADFARLPLPLQAQAIADDLQQEFWDEAGTVIANSFGAYLFLFANLLAPVFPGKVLLLSPVIGAAPPSDPGRVGFSPPYADRLMALARSGELVLPERCEIHVGAQDSQCPPDRLTEFGRLTQRPVTIVPKAGHMLDHGYVSALLDRWLD